MPKAKTKSAPSRSEALDEPSTSQAPSQSQSLTQAEKQLSSLSLEDIERKVNELVQFLLIMDQKKLPIKRQDINKHVLKESSKAFPVLIEKAQEKLAKLFGITLIEIDHKLKSYILVNALDQTNTTHSHLEWSNEENAKTGLLMMVLSLIYMNNNVIQDSLLYHTLKKVGVDFEKPHECFGDVKKLLTQEFVRQGYIEYIRQPTSDPPTYEYKWGSRAFQETTKKGVLRFVCQVYGDMDMQLWTSQYQDAMQSEEGMDVQETSD